MRCLCFLALVHFLLDLAVSESGTNRGKQFLVPFMFNFGKGPSNETANFLFIASEQSGTVHIEMARMHHVPGWKHNQTLTPGGTITITLPDQSEMPGLNTLEKRAVHVYSDVDISVHAMNDDVSVTSADAAVILPVTALSTNYVILSPTGNPAILVVGLIPGTQVTIHFKSTCRLTYNGKNYANGTLIETLDNQDVLQLMPKLITTRATSCDMTGTRVTSTEPVAVFTGSPCIYNTRDSGCDHEMQQVFPDSVLGSRFIIPDLADNRNYKVKVVAAYDSTHIDFNEHYKDLSIHNFDVFLDKDEFREFVIPDGTILEIFSNRGIQVTQFDGSPSPFSVPIPAIENYGSNYSISTMNNPTSANFLNYLNIVVHRDSADIITIDGATVEHSKWERVRDLGYSVATVSISAGSHHIVADDTFMVMVYGYDGAASYAFQAGYFFTNLPPAHLGPTDYPPATFPTQKPGSTTAAVPCEDGPGTDCKVLDATLGICGNNVEASRVCRKFCGLCQSSCTNPGTCVVG